MEWADRLNAALQYIEKHLQTDASIQQAAEEANCSVYHFQRTFHAILGLTVAEYIRKRRLSLAAADLQSGTRRVIDVAATYGYESPNAFTRAFRAMHGVNPGEAASPGTGVKAYAGLKVAGPISGGDTMDYRIVQTPAFQVIGKKRRFSHESFLKEAPLYWKDYVKGDEYTRLW